MLCLIVGSLVVLPSAVLADTADIIKQHDLCVSAHSDNMSWGGCGATEVDALDKELNKSWETVSSLMKDASPENFKTLLADERLWIKWKEQACLYWKGDNFGSEQDVLSYPGCVAGILQNRIVQLDNLADELSGH
jgi:uncharacterized protein YecT (DUF1311 family)